jgi:hypothetical protein
MRTNRIPPGRWCAVRDTKTNNSIVEAIVVDRGVRLQTGEHFGEKRIKGEYEFLECVEPPSTNPLCVAMAELNEP